MVSFFRGATLPPPRFVGSLVLLGFGVATACKDVTKRDFTPASDAAVPAQTTAASPLDASVSSADLPTWGSEGNSSPLTTVEAGTASNSASRPPNSTPATSDHPTAVLSTAAPSTDPLASEESRPDSSANNRSSSAGQSSDAPSASGTDSSTAPSDRWHEATPLFTSEEIAQIDIQLPEESMSSLRAYPQTYVHGTLGLTLTNGAAVNLADIGVRLKGRLGSARTIDQKSSFLLKMSEFTRGQRLFGLNKLALNNLVQDPSMLHEQLAYELFRAMDVPAPRTGYARVTVNGELKGLYATIEVIDNTSFLEHWFPNSEGNLYEGSYGTDLQAGMAPYFDQDRGLDVGFSDLIELIDALDRMVIPETFTSDVQPWIDLDAYVRFAATELYLSHWDGYAATRNNYFIYRPTGDQWHWLPWGTDQTFGDVGAAVWNGTGRIQQMCESSQACRQKLATAYGTLNDLVTQLDFLHRVDVLESAISQAAEEDPGKEYDSYAIHAAIEQLRGFLRDRSGYVESELRCTDPSSVDEDGDGWPGCGQDCDDGNGAIYPGANEACNLIDDDCSGAVDDGNDCPQCVTLVDESNAPFAFCFNRLDYWSAQQECRNLGGELVSVHSQSQHDWLLTTSNALNVGYEWWIGFNDVAEEGTFQWDDGSTVDYTNWNYGEPNDWGGSEDCGELSWGLWNDLPCDFSIGRICAL